jgi:hypothetical protein
MVAASFNLLTVGQLNLPEATLFDLADGRDAEVGSLKTLITNLTLPFWGCSKSKLSPTWRIRTSGPEQAPRHFPQESS